jgi:hypothetical protein
VRTLVFMESTLGYHSKSIEALTRTHKLGLGHCQVGSLTGAVASEKVTEASKGYLSAVGNRINRVQRHKVA